MSALIGAFYLATIREGHVWGDDWAAYVHQAKNIVEGRPCGDIGYIRSPTSLAPKMYPMGFPLLLAPVYAAFGFKLTAMKVLCIGLFCAALLLLYLLLREAGEGPALATVAIIGLCPYFWDFKDTLCSEFPFLAFAYGALLVAHRATDPGRRDRNEVALGVLSGLVAGLACWIRGPGIVLLPTMLLASSLANRRWVTKFNVAAASVFMATVAAAKLFFRVEEDYLTPLLRVLSVHSLLASPWYYFRCLAVPWDNGYSAAVQWTVYLTLAGLAVYGAWCRVWGSNSRLGSTRGSPDSSSQQGALATQEDVLGMGDISANRTRAPLANRAAYPSAGVRSLYPPRSEEREAARALASSAGTLCPSQGERTGMRRWLAGRWTVIEIFTVIYLGFIVWFPWGGRRYLMPIMPFFVFYALVGARSLAQQWPTAKRLALQTGLAVAVAATFIAKYTTLPWGQIPGGIRTPGFSELVEYLRSEGAPAGPLVFFKARLLALYTGAKVSDPFGTQDSEKVFDYYRKIGVSKAVVVKGKEQEPANRFLSEQVAAHPQRFVLEREIGQFRVYRWVEGAGR